MLWVVLGLVGVLVVGLIGGFVVVQGQNQNNVKHSTAGKTITGITATTGTTTNARTTATTGTTTNTITVTTTSSGQPSPLGVTNSFFTAVQHQDYTTAFQYTDFKVYTKTTFLQASQLEDQAHGKLISYTINKTTLYSGAHSPMAQITIYITRTGFSGHTGLATLAYEQNTWKIVDGTLW
jgi:cytoskeletal protein RodZ